MTKVLLSTIVALFSWVAAADVMQIPADYELVKVQAACKAVSCKINEETGYEDCRYKVYFDQASFEMIKNLKTAKGYKKTRFSKSPQQICEAGDLPMEGTGNKEIKVVLYSLDYSPLQELF